MSKQSNSASESDDDDCYGPALPPHLANKPQADTSEAPAEKSKSSSSVIGPQLPAHISRTDLEMLATIASDRGSSGPVPHEDNSIDDEDDEDQDIGPYLPDDPRSQMIPKARVPKPKEAAPTKREEWMLICPKNRSLAVGLGPRQFLGRTPDELVFDKDGEADEESEDSFLDNARAELANKSEQERDQQMEGLMSKGGNQKESLLSIHRKRKLEEEDKSSDPKERRPFDRDTDLKVGGLSKEDKDKFIKRSEELASRFKGGKKKFL